MTDTAQEPAPVADVINDPESFVNRMAERWRSMPPEERARREREAQERNAEATREWQNHQRSRVIDRIPPRYSHASSADIPSAAVPWVRRYIDGSDRESSLMLSGPTGTGKTHATWGIGRTLIESMWPFPTVVHWNVTRLMADLRPNASERPPHQIIGDCHRAAVLVLDDIGAHKGSEWTDERLYEIVDRRYEMCAPVIVTTNVPPAELSAVIGDRLASRLAEMCRHNVVPMTGSDRRRGG